MELRHLQAQPHGLQLTPLISDKLFPTPPLLEISLTFILPKYLSLAWLLSPVISKLNLHASLYFTDVFNYPDA